MAITSSDEGVRAKKQHTKPCHDCPMRRKALPGWLGIDTPEDYLKLCHSDFVVNCHVIVNMQCAGMAIYRRNVCKRVDPPGLILPKDADAVFATPMEFLDHHRKGPAGAKTRT